MKKIFLIISLFIFFNCTNSENKTANKTTDLNQPMLISFELGQNNVSEGVIVAYTNDPDSLWLNEDWIAATKSKMRNLSSTYSTVLLFNKEENMPEVAMTGMNYPLEYDKYLVCGYWIFPNGKNKFCYGGSKNDGNFKHCE